jgi:hypothetical protein
MEEDEEKPYGYIYQLTNLVNDKKYVGQTITERWKDHQVPIEERWKEEAGEAFRKQNRGEDLRYVERAITKYGQENFDVRELDTAMSQEELDAKETQWIKDLDTMDPEKGYNMKEGGLAGLLSDMAKENVSKSVTEKYRTDEDYYEKQINERRSRAQDPDWINTMTEINQERAKDSEWINKMTSINQEIARNKETQEKMSKSVKEKWQDTEYQEKVSDRAKEKWQEAAYREKQFIAKSEGRREIKDKGQFLKDIQEMSKKELIEKYNMDGKCINRRIREMLNHRGVNNYSEAKKYLEDKNQEQVLRDIKEKLKGQTERHTVRKHVQDKQEFIRDIRDMLKKDVAQKYNLSESTIDRKIREMFGHHGVKNYSEAREYLREKNLDDVFKEVKQRLSDKSRRYEGKSQISDKEQFLKDVNNMKKNEIVNKYDMDGKTINNRIKEMLGPDGPKNYTELKEYLKEKNVDEVLKEIKERENEQKTQFKEEKELGANSLKDDKEKEDELKPEDTEIKDKSKEEKEEPKPLEKEEIEDLKEDKPPSEQEEDKTSEIEERVDPDAIEEEPTIPEDLQHMKEEGSKVSEKVLSEEKETSKLDEYSELNGGISQPPIPKDLENFLQSLKPGCQGVVPIPPKTNEVKEIYRTLDGDKEEPIRDSEEGKVDPDRQEYDKSEEKLENEAEEEQNDTKDEIYREIRDNQW